MTFFTVLKIKFEYCYFASIFEGVMPLLELRILEIGSFPHFSPTCFDIAEILYITLFNVLKIKFECATLRQFFKEVCLFLN